MKTNTQVRLYVLLLVFALAFPASAFQYPLSPEAIREAYFLGSRNDEQSARVFEGYVHTFPKPENGPHIAWIGIETPYVFVATEMAKSLTTVHKKRNSGSLESLKPFECASN